MSVDEELAVDVGGGSAIRTSDALAPGQLRFCQAMELAGVPYCVLRPAGPTQAPVPPGRVLEVLSDRRRSTDVEQIAGQLQYKRVLASDRRRATGVVDYVGADDRGGELTRIRVRYQLPLGADGAGRRLPFEHAVLASRSRDPANGCWFCDADLGVLLRAIWRAGGADAGLAAAFDQLAGDEARVATWTRQLLGAAAALPDLPAAVRCGLPAFHLHGRVRRLLQGCWAAFRGTARSAPRSVPAGGGLSIALVGCDGAGKSSVGRELGRWLATELRVERVYLGSGQGTSSLLRWPMLLVHRLIHRRVAGNRAPVTAAAAARRSWLRRLLRPVWALVLAREKQQKLRCVWRTRHAGAIVICDRYPQNEIMDYNDGPLLSHWRTDRHVWRRALARWERRPYEWAQLHPPDLVLKLRVSAGVALARKPDTSAAEVARRTAALDTLQFGHATRTVVIDADAPLQQVLRAAKAAILAEL